VTVSRAVSTFHQVHAGPPSLLWWDDDPKRELSYKIKNAARAHKRKFGSYPTTCYVNMRVTPPVGIKVGRGGNMTEIRVLRKAFVMPCYYQVQREE